jgi:hypothetical protein
MRRAETKLMGRDCEPPHLSELDEAVFGKRSQVGLAKTSQEPKTCQPRTDLQSILHEKQSPVQEIWNGRSDKKDVKETQNRQKQK